METFALSKTNRGADLLSLNGHQYYFKKQCISNNKHWRCKEYVKYRCLSTIITEGETILKQPNEHSHAGDSVEIAVQKVKTFIKESAKSNKAPTRQILGAAMALVDNADVMARLPRKSAMEKSIQRVHQKETLGLINPEGRNFPIPEQFQHLILFDSGEDDPNRILCIGKQELLMKLNTGDWFGDGTFELVPAVFFQLYTIHTKIGINYPPCVYFLLPNKTGSTYTRLLLILKDLLPEASPGKILLDFEKAALNSFRVEFPDSHISGCFFHLSQSVIRKVNTLGLKRKFEEEIDFSMLVKSLPALAFVPPEDVRDIYIELADTFPDDDRCNDLLNYFHSTYIRGPEIRNGAFRSPLFEPALWNHYNDGLNDVPKTTNCCEGFHNSLRSLFLSPHPTIWTLLKGLDRDIGIHRLTLANAEVRNFEKARKKYEDVSRRLQLKVGSYEQEEDKLKYLKAIVHIQVAK